MFMFKEMNNTKTRRMATSIYRKALKIDRQMGKLKIDYRFNRLTFYSVTDYALSYEAVHTLTHQATA